MQYIQIPNEAKTSIALGIIEQIEASGEHFICPNNQVCVMGREKEVATVKKP